jgi:hypothetical protein
MADSNFLKESGVDYLAIVVDRKDVECCSPEATLRTLRRLLQDRWTVERFCGRLDLGFHGYDQDARELYEIDEVRRFVFELDKKFPFWFYFLNLYTGTLLLILLCLCQHSRRPDGMLVLDEDERERFLTEHYTAVNWIFVTYGLDEKENEALTLHVANYFDNRSKPPLIQ